MDKDYILLIEDDSNDEEFFRLALQDATSYYEIVVIKDGAAALEFIFSEDTVRKNPQLIVLDLKLPKISGLEIVKRIKEDQTTKKIPVIIFSSSMEEKDKFASYQKGADEFIRKPIEFEEFMMTVKKIANDWL